MCGKFMALVSWSEVVDFSQPLTESGGDDGPGEGSNDEVVTDRVGGLLPVIIRDAEQGQAARGEDALGGSRSKSLAPAAADPRTVGNDRLEGAAPHALPCWAAHPGR